MSMLDRLRKQSQSRENATAAIQVINNSELSFSDKLKQVQALEAKAEPKEKLLFAEIYSSLHLLAATPEDEKLIAGS